MDVTHFAYMYAYICTCMYYIGFQISIHICMYIRIIAGELTFLSVFLCT